MKKVISAKSKKIKRMWYIVDAKDKILGRIATVCAKILRGKHRACFVPYLDCGDGVIVINAKEIRVSGNKMKEKMYKRYSGYPSGLKQVSLEQMLSSKPKQPDVASALPARPFVGLACPEGRAVLFR